MLKIAKFMVREGEEPQMTLTTCYQQEDDQTDHEWETIISFSGSVPGQVQSAQKIISGSGLVLAKILAQFLAPSLKLHTIHSDRKIFAFKVKINIYIPIVNIL